MDKSKKQRPVLVVVEHRMVINGEVVVIDPAATGLPDRCKLAMAAMLTGDRYELVPDSIERGEDDADYRMGLAADELR